METQALRIHLTRFQYLLSGTRSILVLMFLLTNVVGLTACSPIQERGDKPSLDWSRSIPLGKDVAGSVGLAVDESGEHVHAIWSYDEGDGKHIRYVQLNESGEQTNVIDVATNGQLKYPRVLSGEKNAHLVWASREPGEPNWRLRHALVDDGGELLSETTALSPENVKVGKYVLDSDQKNGALIVWDQGDPGDLYYVHVGPQGEIINGPAPTGFSGENPSLSVGPDRTAHLAWIDDRNFYYAQLDPENPGKAQAARVVDLNASGTLGLTGDTLRGPILG